MAYQTHLEGMDEDKMLYKNNYVKETKKEKEILLKEFKSSRYLIS